MSCGTLLQNPKSNRSIVNYHQISTRTLVIIRNTCHRCIYLLVTVIFAIVVCTINFFIKMYLLWPFLVIFWWLWEFCNYAIFRFTSKLFLRSSFRSYAVQMTNCTSFLISLYDPFETFFCRVISNSTKGALCLNSVCSFTISSKT